MQNAWKYHGNMVSEFALFDICGEWKSGCGIYILPRLHKDTRFFRYPVGEGGILERVGKNIRPGAQPGHRIGTGSGRGGGLCAQMNEKC